MTCLNIYNIKEDVELTLHIKPDRIYDQRDYMLGIRFIYQRRIQIYFFLSGKIWKWISIPVYNVCCQWSSWPVPRKKEKIIHFYVRISYNSKCFKLFGLYRKVSYRRRMLDYTRRWKEQTRERRGQRILFSPCIWQNPHSRSFLYITGTARPSVGLPWPLQHNTNNDVCASAAYRCTAAAGHHTVSQKKKIYTCVSILLVFMGHRAKSNQYFHDFPISFFELDMVVGSAVILYKTMYNKGIYRI